MLMRFSSAAARAALLAGLCSAARAQTLAPAALSTGTEARLRAARPGDVVAVPDFAFDSLPVLPLNVSPNDGRALLLSDAPEYFRTGDGVSLQETLAPGAYRLYLYHVARPWDAVKTITAILENTGAKPVRLTVTRSVFPDPSTDYFSLAKTVLKGWLDPPGASRTALVPPRGWAPLEPRMDHLGTSSDALVHGVFEFEIDQPARLSVLQKKPNQDSGAAASSLPKLPMVLPGQHESGAGRGLFRTGDLDVSDGPIYDSAQGPAQVIVADGASDPWIVGRDGITGTDGVADKGNYGTLYNFRVRYRTSASASGSRLGVALLFTSRRTKDSSCNVAAGVVRAEGETVVLPSQAATIDGEPDTVLIRRYAPVADGATGVITLTYSPPGASCLPTPLLLVPYRP